MDGAKEFIFKNNKFKYIDRYYGDSPFSGQEIVFEDNNIIWSMNYYGFVDALIPSVKDVFNFLKKALLKVEIIFPFRGPNYFKKDNFEYLSDTKGNLKHFIGREYITYNTETVYVCNYHGGIIIKKNNF
jgi:hypothetical protein